MVPFHVPFPVAKKMFPFESAASPPPLIQTPFALPSAEVLKAASCASVLALYDMIQPCQGLMSQCEDQPITTCPFSSNRPAR